MGEVGECADEVEEVAEDGEYAGEGEETETNFCLLMVHFGDEDAYGESDGSYAEWDGDKCVGSC